MKVLDTYDLTLKVNSQNFEIDSSYISFLVKYSIYDSIPTCIMMLTDSTGLIQEYLLTTPGTNFDIHYGIGDSKIYLQGFIRNDVLPTAENPSVLGGDVELPLVHRWLKDQVPRTNAYSGRISEVITQLSSSKEYKDLKTKVDSTENDYTWYQGLKTDYNFIKEVLLPRAYSRNSKGTPFYFFIDELNNFQLRSYKSMILDKPVDSLIYYQANPNKQEEVPQKNLIYEIGKKHQDFFENKKFYKVQNYIQSLTNGGIETKDISLNTFYNESNNKLPMKKLSTTDPTNVLWWGKNYDPEDIEGQKNFYFRSSLQQDKLMISTPFNPNLNIGKTVDIKSYTYSSGGDTRNLSQYSGRYLIEETNHIYDGFNQKALTRCTVSRANTKLFEGKFNLKNELI